MLTDKFINITQTFLKKYNDRYHTDYKYNIVSSDISINPYNEWDFDSLDMVEYIMDLEDAYKIEILDELVIELKTIGELCDFCETKSK